MHGYFRFADNQWTDGPPRKHIVIEKEYYALCGAGTSEINGKTGKGVRCKLCLKVIQGMRRPSVYAFPMGTYDGNIKKQPKDVKGLEVIENEKVVLRGKEFVIRGCMVWK